MTPPETWTSWIDRETHLFSAECDDMASVNDDYHSFLMCNWAQLIGDRKAFTKYYGNGRIRFEGPGATAVPLREMSECMYRLDERSGNWGHMRDILQNELSADAQDVLAMAEASSPHFDSFFEGFARASAVGGVR